MSPEFWTGKRVLVTGHTGFKGGWLSIWLQSLGAHVIGLSLPPATSPNLFEAAGVADGMTSIEGDVRDLDAIARVVDEHRPEIVIHMSAQAVVSVSYADPADTYATNVMGTVNVLEAVRRAGDPKPRAVLVITSDKCYENNEWIWGYRENDALGGSDPYSSSKACAELVVRAYRDSFFPASEFRRHGVAIASARAGNVIGGGDWAQDRLVPDIMRAIMDGRAAEIRRPDATRPWQLVLEALAGYLLLAAKLWDDGEGYSSGWNFGPDPANIATVAWIADYLTRRWGHDPSWNENPQQQPVKDVPMKEASLLALDCTKSKRLLGWRPRLDLPTTLDWIVEWFQAYARHGSMRSVVQEQIRRYEDLGR